MKPGRPGVGRRTVNHGTGRLIALGLARHHDLPTVTGRTTGPARAAPVRPVHDGDGRDSRSQKPRMARLARPRPEGETMLGIADDKTHHPGTTASNRGRRRAAGIYGAIITASILAASGDKMPTDALVISVMVTLVVYWLAEEYAELLAEQVEGGLLPTWHYIRRALAATWSMVSASYAPLLALIVARLAGASPLTAANIGLAAAVVLLTIHAWAAGRSSQLHRWQLFFATSIAAALGLVMIVLKNLILLHLH